MAEPADYIVDDGEIELNAGRDTTRVTVRNTGDRPVQVGSHYHFFEVNRALDFDRRAAYGTRLDIPAGTAVRFEPGDERVVGLVRLGGALRAVGFAALVDGELDDIDGALRRAREQGFLGAGDASGAGEARAAGEGANAGAADAAGETGTSIGAGEIGTSTGAGETATSPAPGEGGNAGGTS